MSAIHLNSNLMCLVNIYCAVGINIQTYRNDEEVLKIHIGNYYGIKRLEKEFDFYRQ